MKPNWKDAPKWANYLAMDANGGWWWHKNEPIAGGFSEWISDSDIAIAGENIVSGWKETLEARP